MEKTRKFYLIIFFMLFSLLLSNNSNGNGGTCPGTACLWQDGWSFSWSCRIVLTTWFNNCGPDISNTGHPLCGRAYLAFVGQEANPNSEQECKLIALLDTQVIIDPDASNNTNGGALVHVVYTLTFGAGGATDSMTIYNHVFVACYDNKRC